MAFIKFGNYTKEGPGVSKHEKPKKNLFKYFDILREKYWDIIKLILLYLVCCIPVVTIGPATGGLVYVLRNFVNRQPVLMKSDFFDAFKKNWKQLTLLFFINLVFYAIACTSLFLYYSAYSSSKGIFYFIGIVVVLSAIVIFTFMNFYTNLMIVTFDLEFKKMMKNAFIFAGSGLKGNFFNLIIIAFFTVSIIFLSSFMHPVFLVLLIILVVLPITLLALVFNAFPTIRRYIIDPYYKEKGIPNPLDKYSNDIEDDERVFSDDVKQDNEK